MTEKTYNIDELRELGEYPGIAYEQKAHFSRFTNKTVKHRDYRRSYSFTTCVLMFFVFAIIGWCWEVGIHFIEDGVFINRGTMMGPWLPIYGAGGVGTILLFRKSVNHQIGTFLGVVAVCGTAEFFTSLYLEKIQDLKYWDYNGYFLNINGRVCFEGMLVFGFACCAGIYIIAPLLDDILAKISKKMRIVICVVLCCFFVADFAYSTVHPNQGKGITDYCYTVSNVINI